MADDTIAGVDFVALPTADLEASVAFYGDVLGLERSAYAPERGYAEFETGNLTLSVMNPETMGMQPFTSTTHIALHVGDVAAARKRLEGAGIAFEGDTFDTGVCHMAFLRDPHGNPLMLHSRYAPRS